MHKVCCAGDRDINYLLNEQLVVDSRLSNVIKATFLNKKATFFEQLVVSFTLLQLKKGATKAIPFSLFVIKVCNANTRFNCHIE